MSFLKSLIIKPVGVTTKKYIIPIIKGEIIFPKIIPNLNQSLFNGFKILELNNPKIRKNKEIIIEALKQNRESYDYIDSSMKLDKEVNAAFMKYSMI